MSLDGQLSLVYDLEPPWGYADINAIVTRWATASMPHSSGMKGRP
jgi:hypothetical protein